MSASAASRRLGFARAQPIRPTELTDLFSGSVPIAWYQVGAVYYESGSAIVLSVVTCYLVFAALQRAAHPSVPVPRYRASRRPPARLAR